MTPEPRKFAWSYSALSDFETCPRRHHETKILKRWVEDDRTHLNEGQEIHEAMACALKNGSALPAKHAIYQPWINNLLAIPGELMVEQKWALNTEGNACAWGSDDAWLRCVADAVKYRPPVAFVTDWKTGKSKNQPEPLQLILTSLIMFAHYPELKAVTTVFVWLVEDRVTQHTVKNLDIGNEWLKILPRAMEMQRAFEQQSYPPKPNRWCKRWCPVRSCEFHGK